MHNNNYVEPIAVASKMIIEISSLSRDEKEWMKLGVDELAAGIRSLLSSQQTDLSVMGLSLDAIIKIKSVARKCSLDQVMIFPYPVSGKIMPYLCMYGGDRETFCQELGLSLWSQHAVQVCNKQIEELIKAYGVILYMRDS